MVQPVSPGQLSLLYADVLVDASPRDPELGAQHQARLHRRLK